MYSDVYSLLVGLMCAYNLLAISEISYGNYMMTISILS